MDVFDCALCVVYKGYLLDSSDAPFTLLRDTGLASYLQQAQKSPGHLIKV